jgi:hypothetical protein
LIGARGGVWMKQSSIWTTPVYRFGPKGSVGHDSPVLHGEAIDVILLFLGNR